MQIYCEHPVIIRNSRLKDLITRYCCYISPTGMQEITRTTANYWKYAFPELRFSPKKWNVTPENIDKYVVVDRSTGQTFPIFIQVPCGKCELCRDKRSRDWSFRATCETATSTSRPLFLTLTYNNEHLPKCGIFKEEIQLFMKRLRVRLDRLHIKHNIRYFAVGEYGTKSARPHYHMILWNFPDCYPLSTIHSKLKFVEQCWTHCSHDKYDKKGAPITESLGFCYCVPCEKGAIGYVMKYMRKELVQPKGKNPVFFLSSRKNGGIGSAYARQYKEFYLKNPQVLDMTVTDPYTGVSTTCSIPQYFRSIFYPCVSQCISKEIRDAHKKLCNLITRRFALHDAMYLPNRPKLFCDEKRILKKYSVLNYHISLSPNPALIRDFRELPYTRLEDIYVATDYEIGSLLRYLYLETYDKSWLSIRDNVLQKRTDALSKKFSHSPEININEVKYNLIQARKLAILKERI